jgi:hypothetical protein
MVDVAASSNRVERITPRPAFQCPVGETLDLKWAAKKTGVELSPDA